MKADHCTMPGVLSEKETKTYRGIRDLIVSAHCARGDGPHKCAGSTTIDRRSITLQCPLCGDAKKILDS